MIAGVRRVSGGLVDSGTSTSNSTVFTFSNVVPVRGASERVVVAIAYDGNNNRDISSLTIAGEEAAPRTSGVEDNMRWDVWDALVPAGPADDLVVTLAGNLGIGAVMLVAVFFLGNAEFRTGNDNKTTSGASASASRSVRNGEYVVGLGVAYTAAGAGNISWSGLTELVDVDLRDSRLSAAGFAVTADATLTATVAWVKTGSFSEKTGIAIAVYSPA